MATLVTLKTRIADELYGRSDLTSQIALAVASAIQHYEIERWGFNESVDSTSTFTTYDTPAVSLPSGLLVLDTLQLTTTSGLTELDPVSWGEYRKLVEGVPSPSTPTRYARYANRVYLWPAPNSTTCTLVWSGLWSLTTTSDSASTAWTNEAEPLIRERAKADVLTSILKDTGAQADLASVSDQGGDFLSRAERTAYLRLRARTSPRVATGRIVTRAF